MNVFRICIESAFSKSNEERVIDYLTTWNGETGLDEIGDNLTENEVYEIIGEFTKSYFSMVHLGGKIYGLAFYENGMENLIDVIYSDGMSLKWVNGFHKTKDAWKAACVVRKEIQLGGPTDTLYEWLLNYASVCQYSYKNKNEIPWNAQTVIDAICKIRSLHNQKYDLLHCFLAVDFEDDGQITWRVFEETELNKVIGSDEAYELIIDGDPTLYKLTF